MPLIQTQLRLVKLDRYRNEINITNKNVGNKEKEYLQNQILTKNK
jgi:hypothetical protein